METLRSSKDGEPLIVQHALIDRRNLKVDFINKLARGKVVIALVAGHEMKVLFHDLQSLVEFLVGLDVVGTRSRKRERRVESH